MSFRVLTHTLAALALAPAMGPVHAQVLASADLAARTIARRAVDATIWGMLAVNYDLMLQEMLNQFASSEPGDVSLEAANTFGFTVSA